MPSTSYQLLKDTLAAINRVEDKMDKRVEILENRTQIIETKLDQMLGKIGIGVLVLTLGITSIVTLIVELIKEKIFGKV